MRLRRVPELTFHFDESVENQAKIEKILLELEEERRSRKGSEENPPNLPNPPDKKDRP
jgi:hypothetical protein